MHTPMFSNFLIYNELFGVGPCRLHGPTPGLPAWRFPPCSPKVLPDCQFGPMVSDLALMFGSPRLDRYRFLPLFCVAYRFEALCPVWFLGFIPDPEHPSLCDLPAFVFCSAFPPKPSAASRIRTFPGSLRVFVPRPFPQLLLFNSIAIAAGRSVFCPVILR